MLPKKDSYIYKQITFGLLGLRCMFDKDTLSIALQESDIKEAKGKLEASVKEKYREMLEFIFEELFSTEDGTGRISEVYSEIYSVDMERFVLSYRYRNADILDDFTNGCVEEIAASIIAVDRPSNLLDLCSGQGVFLTSYFYFQDYKLGNTKEYCGIEINRQNVLVSKLKYLILGLDPDDISIGDIFNSNFNKITKKYDAVFCHMPISMMLDQKKLVSCGLFEEYEAARICKRASEWAFVKAAQKLTNTGGKTVAVVPTGLLFTEIGKQFRKELMENETLEAVILMPPNLLNNTGIQIAMLVLSSGNETVKMIDASGYFIKGRRVNTISMEQMDSIIELYLDDGSFESYADDEEMLEFLRSQVSVVSHKTIADNDYSLEPTKYILKESVSFTNEKKLADATTRIFRGVQIKAEDHDSLMDLYVDEPNCYILNLSDISNGYISDNLEKVHIEDLKRYEKYRLEEGDVVISARGTRINVAVAEDIRDRRIIVTGNLIAIRCNETLNPYYLKAFFESNDGMSMLNSAQTGSAIFAINPKQLQNMSFENANPNKQAEIGNALKWMIDELRDSQKRVASIKQRISHIYDESKEV